MTRTPHERLQPSRVSFPPNTSSSPLAETSERALDAPGREQRKGRGFQGEGSGFLVSTKNPSREQVALSPEPCTVDMNPRFEITFRGSGRALMRSPGQ